MSCNSPRQSNVTLSIPKPGKALIWLMIALTAIWMFYAAGIDTGAAGTGSFQYLVGNTGAVVRGQVWRLFTAPFLHLPTGNGSGSHLLFTLLGLYVFGTSLEKNWGAKRFLLFAYGASVLGFATQIVAGLIVPSVSQVWLGASAAVLALAVAWVLESGGQAIRLFGFIPIAPKVFAGLVVALCLLHSFWGTPSEGTVASVTGMIFGYLAGGDPSTIRRLWLRYRLRNLQSQAKKMVREDRKFRVIEGGKGRRTGEGSEPPKKWLN